LPYVEKNLTIEGNGVTLTPSAAWTGYGSQMLWIAVSGITVNISRVHFKNGRAMSDGAAIYNRSGTVNLESCIFSGNMVTSSSGYGGAIYNNGTMNVKGCTFYNNSSAYRGGAIYTVGTSVTLTLTGNLFYGNTAGSDPVVYRYSGSVISNGYNVADVPLGTETNQSGWTAADGDTTFSALSISGDPFHTTTFAPETELHLLMPSTAPEDFPAVDFNGADRTWPGAPGAVKQSQ
jgi:predicted outer membrane repeat protein